MERIGPSLSGGVNTSPYYREGWDAFALATAVRAGPADNSSIGRARWQAAAVLNWIPDEATLVGPRAKTGNVMRS